MHFIPTTTAKVDALKKRAKRQARNGGGKHTDILDQVAQAAGYAHWHHVSECLKESEAVNQGRSLTATIEHVLRLEQRGEVAMVGTGRETSSAQSFLLFSTGIGDAWMLDPIRLQACCLMWQGERQAPTIRDLPDRVEILWEGSFELRGPFFEVDLDNPRIRRRAIGGYPVDALRRCLLAAQPPETSIQQVFGQDDAVPLTEAIIARLVRDGWQATTLTAAARQGARYSPSRDTVLYPPLHEPMR